MHDRFAKLNGWERLAVVLSVLWCLGALIATWDNRIGYHYSVFGFSVRWNRLVMASIALAPALLWIAFLATQWVAQGFGEMPRSNVAIPAPIQANAQRNAHTSKAPKGIRGFWVFVAGALLFLVYVGIFIPAFAGHKAIPQTAGGSITGTAMFFYLLWRWRGKQGWHGALLGALVGVIVIFMAAALSSYEIAHSAPWNSFTPTQ